MTSFDDIMKEFEKLYPEWDWRGYRCYKNIQKVHEIDDDLMDSEEKQKEIERLLKRWSPGDKK